MSKQHDRDGHGTEYLARYFSNPRAGTALHGIVPITMRVRWRKRERGGRGRREEEGKNGRNGGRPGSQQGRIGMSATAFHNNNNNINNIRSFVHVS